MTQPVRESPEAMLESGPDGLVARFRGTADAAWFKAQIVQVIAAVRATAPRSVLIDSRDLTLSLTDFDRYDLGVMAVGPGLGLPIAMVGKPTTVDPRRLGEVVARNRGGNVRVFTDYDEARAWLRQQLNG